jgi:hypothetical protein
MAVFKSDIEKARSEIAKLQQARERLQTQRATAEAEIAALRLQLPDAELAEVLSETTEGGVTPQQIRERIRQGTESVAVADRAEGPLLARLQQAHADLAEAQAREVDKRGDKVEKQLADHCAKVNALLTQLTELEEGGTFLSTASHTRQVLSLSVMSGGGKTLPPDNLGTVTIPKSERIAQELQGLRQQAAAIRSQRLVTKGRISGYSLEELLDKLRTPNTLAPSESAIRSWFAGQSGKVAQMQTAIAASGENQKVVFVLVFGDGKISKESTVVRENQQVVSRGTPGQLLAQHGSAGPVYSGAR